MRGNGHGLGVVRSWIPRTVRHFLRRAGEVAWAKAGRWRVECPVCGGRFRSFLPAGRAQRPNARCPVCGSLERHRLQWIYFEERTDLFTGRRLVLHFAPEPCLAGRLAGSRGIEYVTADLGAIGVAVRADITRTPFAADRFDVILCSHVLEHVPDDAAAMAELYRILRPGGWALLQVPLDETRARTFEDPAVVDPAERELLFGQVDHVRVYGRDYGNRLRRAGFDVRVDRFAYELDPRLVERHALMPESLYVCHKPRRIPG